MIPANEGGNILSGHFKALASAPYSSSVETFPKAGLSLKLLKPNKKERFNNVLLLMHFFNHTAGMPLFNERLTFLQYLGLTCGTNMTKILKLVKTSFFDISPGMLVITKDKIL
jgi:hypothetical protein